MIIRIQHSTCSELAAFVFVSCESDVLVWTKVHQNERIHSVAATDGGVLSNSEVNSEVSVPYARRRERRKEGRWGRQRPSHVADERVAAGGGSLIDH